MGDVEEQAVHVGTKWRWYTRPLPILSLLLLCILIRPSGSTNARCESLHFDQLEKSKYKVEGAEPWGKMEIRDLTADSV